MHKEGDLIFGSGSPLGDFLSKISDNCLASGKDSRSSFFYDLATNNGNLLVKFKEWSFNLSVVNIFFIGYFFDEQVKVGDKNASEILLLHKLINILNTKTSVNIFYMSTISLYLWDNNSNKHLDTSFPLNLSSPYRIHKYNIENELLELSVSYSVLKVFILRLPCLVGYNARNNFLSKIRYQLSIGQRFTLSHITSPFNSVFSFFNVYQLSKILKLTSNNYKIYNVGSANPVALNTIFNKICPGLYDVQEYYETPPIIIDIFPLLEIGFIPPDTSETIINYIYQP